MKKKVLIIGAVCLIVLIAAGAFFFYRPAKVNQSALEKNLLDFYEKTMAQLPVETTQVSMAQMTDFEWDAMYRFGGYTQTEQIDEILGFKSKISPTYHEANSNIVFVKDKRIVCHIITGDKPYFFDMPESKAVTEGEAQFDVSEYDGMLQWSLIEIEY